MAPVEVISLEIDGQRISHKPPGQLPSHVALLARMSEVAMATVHHHACFPTC